MGTMRNYFDMSGIEKDSEARLFQDISHTKTGEHLCAGVG